jgi:hypothetical protein
VGVQNKTIDIPRLSNEENVYRAIMQMDKNKAPNSDGFPA